MTKNSNTCTKYCDPIRGHQAIYLTSTISCTCTIFRYRVVEFMWINFMLDLNGFFPMFQILYDHTLYHIQK